MASVVGRLAAVQDALRAQAADRLERLTRRDILDLAAAEQFFANDEGFVLAKWCGRPECETGLKHLGVTIRCLPSELHSDGSTCLVCGDPATVDAVWAESY